VLCELEKHLAAVHGNSNSGAVAIAPGAHAPSEFVRGFFEHVAPWFKLGTQEDAHEFLRLLIDAMQKSARNARLQHNPQEDNGGGGGSSRGGSADGKDNDDDNNNDTKDDGRRTEGLSAAGNTSTNTNNTAISKDDTEYPFSLFRGTVESVRCNIRVVEEREKMEKTRVCSLDARGVRCFLAACSLLGV
jgi:hypothetical protein